MGVDNREIICILCQWDRNSILKITSVLSNKNRPHKILAAQGRVCKIKESTNTSMTRINIFYGIIFHWFANYNVCSHHIMLRILADHNRLAPNSNLQLSNCGFKLDIGGFPCVKP